MFYQWMNDKLKKLNYIDFGVVKICLISFALLLAKFWPVILGLDWYWYAIIFVVSYIYLITRVFGK